MPKPELKLLPYHDGTCEYLQREERAVWDWYVAHRVRDDQADTVRFELLKSTYRIEPESQPELYRSALEVASMLSLDVPVTIYQAQNPTGLNASLACLPGEAHLVLHGPLTSKLTASELKAMLGHELSHLLLWRQRDGELLIADQILAAMTNDSQAGTPHVATARLFRLYSEIFCDRGAAQVVGDPTEVVSMLVKLATGLDEVNGASYVRQADEIFSRESPRTDQLTHPEAFIRARAVSLWANGLDDVDAHVTAMIEGPPEFESLDLLGQQRVAAMTRSLIDQFLAPQWLQTELTLGHARLFFDGYSPDASGVNATLAEDIGATDATLQDYFCYVLLDFVTADRDLELLPLAAAIQLCEQLGLEDRFAELARQELRLRKRQYEKINREKAELLATAANRAATT